MSLNSDILLCISDILLHTSDILLRTSDILLLNITLVYVYEMVQLFSAE